MSLFGKKRVATPGGEKSTRLQDLEALERTIRYDPDVAKRRNAVEAVIEAVRTFRSGLNGIKDLVLQGSTMAGPTGQRQAEATTDVEKYVKGIRHASLVLWPATGDGDALMRSRAYTGLAEAVASQMIGPETIFDATSGNTGIANAMYSALGGCLTQGMKDAEVSVRIAAATSLGEYLRSWAKAPGEARDAVGALVDHLEDPDQAVREAVRVALQHGIKSIPPDTLASHLAGEDIWRRAAEAIRESPADSPSGHNPTEAEGISQGEVQASASETVESLLMIYAANPEGFGPGYGDPSARERVRQVGEALNLSGGMDLMLEVHAEFAGRCRISGAARNLEHTWDGVGDWRG